MEKLPLPEAILFDLDDTIVTSSVGIENLWHDLCHEHASLIEGIDGDTLLEAVRKARKWYWSDPERHRRGRLNLIKARRETIDLAFSWLKIDSPDVSKSLADTYSTQVQERVMLFPKAIDTLLHFKDAGLKLALVTNGASDVQRRKIDRFKLGTYFNYIVIEGEFGAGKPDRAMFTHTLDKLGVTPGEAWMVGDDLERDIIGAKHAGMYSVWVDRKDEGLPEETTVIPDRIINDISELGNG